MGCTCDVNNPQTYLGCAGDAVRQVTDKSTMTTYAAQAGASSNNWSMCLAMMFLYSRRMQYWKVTPGDCGSPGTAVLGSAYQIEKGAGTGLATAAMVDPEPISKGILAGVAAIFGGFTAHHAAAVSSEQSTLCGVTNSFNYVLNQVEQGVMNGQITAVTGASILQQAFGQLQGNLNSIKKGQNAAWGYQIAMTALNRFEQEVVLPALEASHQLLPASAPSSQVTINNPAAVLASQQNPYVAPLPNPTQVLSSVGAVGGMNANNSGEGPTSLNLPFQLTPGTIVLIGGVAFVASEL